MKSIVDSISTENFQNIVTSCNSIFDVVRHFQLPHNGASFLKIKERVIRENIDLSHFSQDISFRKEKTLEECLTENSLVDSSTVKRKLLESGLLQNVCYICGLNPLWNNEILVLQLDHINGKHTDNRLENLRILCPNCHTQTGTFGRKRNRKLRRCSRCGKVLDLKKSVCKECYKISRSQNAQCQKRKFEISKEELEKLVWIKSSKQIGKDFGVSDKAIEKRCKKFGISKPPRGYWRKHTSAGQ